MIATTIRVTASEEYIAIEAVHVGRTADRKLSLLGLVLVVHGRLDLQGDTG